MDDLDAIARTEIQPGWDVYDADGDLVGRVLEVSDMSLAVETTGLVEAIGSAEGLSSGDRAALILAVPEPASLGVAGSVGLWLAGRRRRPIRHSIA